MIVSRQPVATKRHEHTLPETRMQSNELRLQAFSNFLNFSKSLILMARLEGETSNALFDELEQWNTLLKQSDIDLEELSND